PDLDLRLHVGVEADGDLVDAERLDGLVQVDHALLHFREALGLQLVLDVRRGDGAEELAFLADLGGEGEGDFLEALGDRRGGVAAGVLGGFQALLLLGDALLVAEGRLVGDAARQQEVAGVASRDLDDVTRVAEVVHGLTKNDFHIYSERWDCGRGRLRQSSQVSPTPTTRATAAITDQNITRT